MHTTQHYSILMIIRVSMEVTRLLFHLRCHFPSLTGCPQTLQYGTCNRSCNGRICSSMPLNPPPRAANSASSSVPVMMNVLSSLQKFPPHSRALLCWQRKMTSMHTVTALTTEIPIGTECGNPEGFGERAQKPAFNCN